jgi:hypothetical protein
MRTVTEFSGSTIAKAHAVRARLLGEGVAAEAMAERLGAEVGLTGDRVTRLLEALEAVGADPSRVRLVRVFPAEEQPKGSTKIGEFNYLVDLQPSAPPRGKRDRDRGGRGRPFGGGGKPGAREAGTGMAREERGPMPHAGSGWVLTRDPSAPREDRRRGKGGPPKGKKGPRRGGPPGPRGPHVEHRGQAPGGAPQGERRGPPGPRGPRPPQGEHRGPLPAGAAGAPESPGAAGAPGEAPHNKRRRRRGGRGRGGPRPLRPGQPMQEQPGALQPGSQPGAQPPSAQPTAPPQPSAQPPSSEKPPEQT